MSRCRACGDRLPTSRHAAGVCASCDPERWRRIVGLAKGRQLTCHLCGAVEWPLEACHGAACDEEHLWLDEAAYECTGCLSGRAERLPEREAA